MRAQRLDAQWLGCRDSKTLARVVGRNRNTVFRRLDCSSVSLQFGTRVASVSSFV
jgi:hypothetical protein